jgi:hypothetical protein
MPDTLVLHGIPSIRDGLLANRTATDHFGAYKSALDCIPSAAWAADRLVSTRSAITLVWPGRMNGVTSRSISAGRT